MRVAACFQVVRCRRGRSNLCVCAFFGPCLPEVLSARILLPAFSTFHVLGGIVRRIEEPKGRNHSWSSPTRQAPYIREFTRKRSRLCCWTHFDATCSASSTASSLFVPDHCYAGAHSMILVARGTGVADVCVPLSWAIA